MRWRKGITVQAALEVASTSTNLLYVADFYVSDLNSGTRVLVRAGNGAKVVSFVKPATTLHVSIKNIEQFPSLLRWLQNHSIPTDDLEMRFEEGFREVTGHIVSLHFLEMRYHEMKRHKDYGHFPPTIDCSNLDIEHVILYHGWLLTFDQFILDFYKDRMKEVLPDSNLRHFFNAEDWQDMQYEFEFHLKCCPTQTQLQSRLHMLLRN
ncbi:hypothetical protein M5K25_026709 [Dendrobium thyrsiflorum]|uniref:Uncharacterized protein n=1 Tax=Dendrobium thyrsiflorum TaxID=117978 RepID=A0ABD0TXZ2_DENTH